MYAILLLLVAGPPVPDFTPTPNFIPTPVFVEPLSKPTDPLRLLMISDGSPACQKQLAAVYAVRKQCDVVVATEGKGDNAAKLATLGLPKERPYWILYRGHEALEESSGPLTAGNIAYWFGSIRRGEARNPRYFWKSATQDRLTNLDRVEMRMRRSEATCGMAWCYSHRYLILDYTTVPDANGASRAQKKPTEGNACPSGGCPTGGCPSGIFRRRFQ